MNVPKIRYDNFTKEWEKVKLSSQASFLQGLTYTPNDVSNDGTIVLRSSNIQNSMVDYNDIVRVNIIIPEKLKIKENDILMCVRNGSKSLVGKTAWLSKNEEKCTWGAFMNIIRPKEKNKFVYYYLNSKYFYNHVWKDLGTATVNQITKQTLESCYLNIPSIEEQEKISNTLSLLDQKIKLQNKKIEDLKLFKKGLIQKIFSSNNLSEVQIKDLGTIITGTTPSKENKNYWNGGTIAWITPTDINYGRDISNSITSLTKEGLKKGRFVPKNSILVTCIASIGKNAVIKVDGSCNQQINAIITNNNFNSNYIYYLMEYISPYLQSIAGTSATAIVNKETFERIKVKVHNYNDQNRIDKYLSSVETKILLEDKLLNKLIKLKKGFMQNMFV